LKYLIFDPKKQYGRMEMEIREKLIREEESIPYNGITNLNGEIRKSFTH
jgi:hypothetical protein